MDRRQMRITWNENNWEKPSGHPWKKENNGKNNIPFENQYGYGHEEWLFNPRYRIDDYQYGFVRGVQKAKLQNDRINELFLYTKAPNDNQFLIGVLRNVERIIGNEYELDKARRYFSEYYLESIMELNEVNADTSFLTEKRLEPILKFKWSEATILEEPILVNIDQSKYRRYQPYKLTTELEDVLIEGLANSSNLMFVHGKAAATSTYTKSTKKGKSEITSLHVEILDELHKLLLKSTNSTKLSAELSRVNGKTIDLLEALDEGKYNFYEIKTRNSGLSNIREGLGQILEYALVDNKVKTNKLIIIGPSELKQFELEYFENLKQVIDIPLEFWQYNLDSKTFSKK